MRLLFLYHQKPLIGVKGRIESSCYEKDGKNIYKMQVVAEKVTFLSSKKADE